MSQLEIQKAEKSDFYLMTGFKILVISAFARAAEKFVNGSGVIKAGSIIAGGLIGKAVADAVAADIKGDKKIE